MLNILEGFDIERSGQNSAENLHCLIEAKKIAFGDRDSYVSDPEFERIPTDTLLSKEYAKECGKKIDPNKAAAPPGPSTCARGSDTVFVTAVDQERNAIFFDFFSNVFQK